MEICDCIINHNFRHIPITEDGKFAGLISRKDLMTFLLNLRGKQEHGN
jgi:CBS domain-containing protein